MKISPAASSCSSSRGRERSRKARSYRCGKARPSFSRSIIGRSRAPAVPIGSRCATASAVCAPASATRSASSSTMPREGRQAIRSARRLLRFEYFLRDQRGGHRRRPARIEGQMGDQLANLVLGDAVAEGAFEVTAQLPLAAECNKRRHGDQAAIALRQARAFPDLAVNDLLGKLDELWRDRSNLLAGG